MGDAPPTGLEPGVVLDADAAHLLAEYDAMQVEWAARVAAGGMAEYRTFADAVFARFRGPEHDGEPAHVLDLSVPGAEGLVPARLYRPEGSGPWPLLVFLHGGGWSLGGLDSYDGPAGSLATLAGCAVLAVDYRLAPEHPFPAGLEDAVAAVTHALDHAAEWGADPARVGVMGDSAGGNLAASVARELALMGDRRLRAQFLVYPMTDVASPDDRFPSRGLYGEGRHFLATGGIHFARDTYLGGTEAKADDPRVSVLDAPVPDGLAPAMIVTAGHDPLRDEGADYHRRLIGAGVDSRYHCEAGSIHAFLSFGVLASSRRVRRLLADEVRRLL